jgi:hypothetical protein
MVQVLQPLCDKYHIDDELYQSEHLVISSADIPLHLKTVQVIKHCELAQVIVETEEDQVLLDKLCLPDLHDIQTL